MHLLALNLQVMWVQAASRDHDREAEDGFASEVVAWQVMWVQAASRDHDREAEDGFASEVVAGREKRI
jgi:hypothetical protein